MIKTRINKPQSDSAPPEHFFNQKCGPCIRPEAMRYPYKILFAIKQRIAGAFERNIFRPRNNFEIVEREKSVEKFLLALPLRGMKSADDNLIAPHHASIGGEHHIRQSLLR
jgi:hypothetical protein